MYRRRFVHTLAGIGVAVLAGCQSHSRETPPRLYNEEAVVPPQCYTKTEGRYNPCYVCHQTHAPGTRVNAMDDGELQAEYDFTEAALDNHWTNLFLDRRPLIARISDEEILRYIDEDNFTPLAEDLARRGGKGYVPRLQNLAQGEAAFDAHGFARDGSGWVAFTYKPLPSTFWPANGSVDDVMIRLPPLFRQDEQGRYDRRIYLLNLTILEAAIKDLRSIPIPPTDEIALRRDLNRDRRLSRRVTRLHRPNHYLGRARAVPVTPFLYPEGTEFLHTVRYVGVDEAGRVYAPRRMKEVRYMWKKRFLAREEVHRLYEMLKHGGPDGKAVEAFVDKGEEGFENIFGWGVMGFIEDARGRLRPQSHEEGRFCMGCHTTLGATIDQTFAFARKLTGPPGWAYISLNKLWDAPGHGESKGEILQYFERAGGGDEFRENDDLRRRFFDTRGNVLKQKVRRTPLAEIITPSRRRALDMNKAYLTLVRRQDYIRGRDANITPMRNVYRRLDPATAPTLPERYRYRSDIRLDWSARRR